ncbi:hypothetical protein CMQ_7176 [Grosmannia clavigera kw1407]|uniref:Uncharacterized protein n=1 Tax=Grosmannia clavigera (strain kw1407 / UAMH 11150) TaxID=655863 RepID=F0XNN1_GROCL|nr:uncharacterized protein CMQ_7176 [Grosmannia clavigera kw1407]EFX00174.1 hypothetical protein CMQ_7176 [Grosmannia clavigera kw1407]
MPYRFEHPYLIHPATLDCALQTSLLALAPAGTAVEMPRSKSDLLYDIYRPVLRAHAAYMDKLAHKDPPDTAQFRCCCLRIARDFATGWDELCLLAQMRRRKSACDTIVREVTAGLVREDEKQQNIVVWHRPPDPPVE